MLDLITVLYHAALSHFSNANISICRRLNLAKTAKSILYLLGFVTPSLQLIYIFLVAQLAKPRLTNKNKNIANLDITQSS